MRFEVIHGFYDESLITMARITVTVWDELNDAMSYVLDVFRSVVEPRLEEKAFVSSSKIVPTCWHF